MTSNLSPSQFETHEEYRRARSAWVAGSAARKVDERAALLDEVRAIVRAEIAAALAPPVATRRSVSPPCGPAHAPDLKE